MKMKILAAAVCAALSTNSFAQYMGTVPPNADVRFMYSQDTDGFHAATGWIGAAHESGIGVRIGKSRYNGKETTQQITNELTVRKEWDGTGNITTNQQTRSSSTTTTIRDVNVLSDILQLTYVKLDEDYGLHGAVGVRKTTQVGAEDRTYLVADVELKLVMTDSLTLGLTVNTDVVESVRSLQTGTRYTYVAGDVDLLLDDNLNLNVIVGGVHFSDDNDRAIARSKLTWTFIPEYGISTYIKTRHQHDSNPQTTTYTDKTSVEVTEFDGPVGGWWNSKSTTQSSPSLPNYYSPKNLHQGSVGIQIRQSYDGLVYTASADFGHEWATTKDGTSTDNPIYSWQLGIQTNPGRKTGTTYGVSVTGSNSSIRGSGGDYNWYGLNSWMKVPF